VALNFVCSFCKEGKPIIIKEMDIEGLSSQIV
jgi:hypothetical protein